MSEYELYLWDCIGIPRFAPGNAYPRESIMSEISNSSSEADYHDVCRDLFPQQRDGRQR